MEFRKHITQRTNVQQIFQHIMEHGPISRRNLQEITGFSWGLISQVTNRLIAEGYLVAEEDLSSAGVGRKAEKLDIVRNNFYYIGVDIDSEGMYAVVTDMKGRLVESERYPWPEKTYTQVLDTLYGILDGYMEKYARMNITSIGVSVQGITDVARGVSVYIKRIKDWVDVPLRELLSSRYDVDVVVAHDPDCMMESECAFGILKNTNAQDVLLVHYNDYAHSLGMSAMVGGKIYFGHRGRAGEIGYTLIGENEDGSPRMLEDDLVNPGLTQTHIFTSVGKAVAIANTLYNPQIIVLHTPKDRQTDEMESIVEHWIRTASYDTSVQILRSKLDNNAKARGAAMIMINRTIDEML